MSRRSFLSDLISRLLPPVDVDSLSLEELSLLLDLLLNDVLDVEKNDSERFMIVNPRVEEFPVSLALKYVSGSYLIYGLPSERTSLASIFMPVPSSYATPRLLAELLREHPCETARYIVENCRRALLWWVLTAARDVYNVFKKLYSASPVYYFPAILNFHRLSYPLEGRNIVVFSYPRMRIRSRLDIEKSNWVKKVISTLYRYYGDRLDSIVLTGSATSPAYVLVRDRDRLKLGDTAVRRGVIMVRFLNVPLLLPHPRE